MIAKARNVVSLVNILNRVKEFLCVTNKKGVSASKKTHAQSMDVKERNVETNVSWEILWEIVMQMGIVKNLRKTLIAVEI